ncbi:hypothetical protein SAICODRAFT_31026 [Saitoella complicata NRRL Y-17804]|uniref:uncharacterized protein n=1 Tax=Saitoella complicata (strain BCRC 22490 / CBS 7301 / JCM 7358 / NBRC 10748 / NRRL Y-17804) TaxID=698492 RepID=UPI00086759A0|nr:uncharacterized protein SAICODRAFT_31026 [Saitoella complicata NRRL Y-17804]ODQ51973.1 hypothetical protein SAICODRAFT_31026 [Saitoella complicata NRRL Y-17804]
MNRAILASLLLVLRVLKAVITARCTRSQADQKQSKPSRLGRQLDQAVPDLHQERVEESDGAGRGTRPLQTESIYHFSPLSLVHSAWFHAAGSPTPPDRPQRALTSIPGDIDHQPKRSNANSSTLQLT